MYVTENQTCRDCGRYVGYTHLPNEITGSYHNDKFFDGFDWKVAAGVAVMFLLAGVILVLG